MDEKIFDLLEKMYIEMQNMKENMATKQDMAEIKENMVRFENKVDENLKALYDGYKQSIEKITEIEEKLDKLTYKVENQEITLQVLKSVK